MRVQLTFVHHVFTGHDQLGQDTYQSNFYPVKALMKPVGGAFDIKDEIYEGTAKTRYEVYKDAFPVVPNESDWYVVDESNERKDIVLVQPHTNNRRKLIVETIRPAPRNA